MRTGVPADDGPDQQSHKANRLIQNVGGELLIVMELADSSLDTVLQAYQQESRVGIQRGELLKYSQAVEEDGSSCVSFASLAFYGE